MSQGTYRYRRFQLSTNLYHITRPEHVEAIEREGLRADDEGNIFAFTDLMVADTIARAQVFADPYALLWVQADGIIKGKVFADEVSEFSAPFQCIIRQPIIPARFVHYLGTMALQPDPLTPWQRLVHARLGMTRRQSEEWRCAVLSAQGGAQ
jgi:hypothetical protein